MNPLFRIDFSISDSLKIVRKSVLIYDTIILAIRTLQKALDSQPMRKGELLLHSDQGTQYTSKAFVEYC